MVRLGVLLLVLRNVIRAVFRQSVQAAVEYLLFFRLEISFLNESLGLMITMLLYLINFKTGLTLTLFCRLLCWPNYLVTQFLFYFSLLGWPLYLVRKW
jgi:hypothetical protein